MLNQGCAAAADLTLVFSGWKWRESAVPGVTGREKFWQLERFWGKVFPAGRVLST